MRMHMMIGAAALVAASSTHAQIERLFGDRSYVTVEQPRQVVSGDLNNDGSPDLVIMGSATSGTQTYLGNAEGTFVPASLDTFWTLYQPVLADVDGDGNLDLLHPVNFEELIQVRPGLGDGSFAEPIDLDPGGISYGLVIADVNEDGHDDILSVNLIVDAIALLLGDGLGGFAEPTLIPTLEAPRHVATGDINNDGHLDLVASCSDDHAVTIHLGLGDGTFEPIQDIPLGTVPTEAQPHDVNGDGHLDLVVKLPGGYRMLRNDGSMNWDELQWISETGTLADYQLTDLDNDGFLDMVFSSWVNNGCVLLKGQPDGTLDHHSVLSIANQPDQFVFDDFNGDGNPDMALVSGLADAFYVASGRDEFGFSFGASTPQTVWGGPFVITHLDDDGMIDCASITTNQPIVDIFRGNCTGQYERRVQLTLPLERPELISAGDVDGDGLDELFITDLSSENGVLLGIDANGDWVIRQSFVIGDRPTAVRSADLNLDGLADFISGNYFGEDLTIFLSDGGGTLHPPAHMAMEATVDDVAITDFTGDGVPDVFVLTGDEFIRGYSGNGDGTFSLHVTLALPGTGYRAFVADDFTQDNQPDLALIQFNEPMMSVFVATSSTTFAAPTMVDSGAAQGALISADVTSDGIADLITNSFHSSNVSCFVGVGDGTFESPRRFASGYSPARLVAEDFNDDGAVDLSLWSGSSKAPVILSMANELTGLDPCRADLNGDEIIDVHDLLAVLGSWGVCDGCSADLNGDSLVDIQDFCMVLATWGPC